MKYWSSFTTPLGRMFCLLNEAEELERLEFEEGGSGGCDAVLGLLEEQGVELRKAGKRSLEIRTQVGEYMRGERTEFDLALARVGTAFQERVWRSLMRVRFGRTITYPELAKRSGNAAAVRAAGHANASNPFSLIVPCHRVIGVDGSLRGYGGTLPVKLALLEFESRDGEAKIGSLLKKARHLKVKASSKIGALAD